MGSRHLRGFGSTELLYAGAVVVGFCAFPFIAEPTLYVVYPIILLSLAVDWQSMRVASRLSSTWLTVFDYATTFNYVGLFIAMTGARDRGPGFSPLLFVHYSGIFWIYIAWNVALAVATETDNDSKRFFVRYSFLEVPLAGSTLLAFAALQWPKVREVLPDHASEYASVLLVVVALLHLAIIVAWMCDTYREVER